MATRPRMLPETLLPRISETRWRREGIPAMAATLAAALRVPAIMGRRETADIVVVFAVIVWLCNILSEEKKGIQGEQKTIRAEPWCMAVIA
jgi:hypothetical protein